MNESNDKNVLVYDVLKKLGAKWAVLTAMTAAMSRKGIKIPLNVVEDLRTARVKIGSGCFSPCEVTCDLATVEGQVFSQCHLLDDRDVKEWCDLLAEAMQGKLDYERISGIPALHPVKNDCEFLRCGCSGAH